MSRKISRDTYLKALGLFTLATEAQRKCDEYEKAMNTLLGEEDQGHMSDEIYSPQWGFDEALRLSGIEVENEEATSE